MEDVRNKLVQSRRIKGDARSVIRQHVVEKFGDLRARLKPKNVVIHGSQKYLGNQRLNQGGFNRNAKPKLVYAEDISNKTVHKKAKNQPKASNGSVTVTVSRYGSEFMEDNVQPTGIPAHMRRQPSPPPPRNVNAASPLPSRPTKSVFNRQNSEDFFRDRPLQKLPGSEYHERSLTPPIGRSHSYKLSSFKRPATSPVPSDYSWAPLKSFRYNDYPDNERLHSGSWSRRPELTMADLEEEYRGHNWERERSPLDNRYRQSPPTMYSRMNYPVDERYPYLSGSYPSTHPSNLRMDRMDRTRSSASNYRPDLRERATDTARRSRRPSPDDKPMGSFVGEPTSYTVRVTNLSTEVSEEDVVELFSDIGPLLSARLIQKGLAEVTFVNERDAMIAIEKYDRRELDGIPMNLKLIDRLMTTASSQGKKQKMLDKEFSYLNGRRATQSQNSKPKCK